MDRNLSMGLDGRFKLWSLSARRAWIEISGSLVIFSNTNVALRKESVDRNAPNPKTKATEKGRSPQGERG